MEKSITHANEDKFQIQLSKGLTVRSDETVKSIKRSIANLPPNMLKDAAFVVAAPSTYVISLSLETNLFPTESKAAKIISVHKSGMH